MRRRSWRNERPARSRHSPRARRALCLAAALVTGILGGVFGGEALLARAFPARAAQVRLALIGARHAPAHELAAAAGIGPGVPLAALDLHAVRAGVATHPWVASVRVAALPPDRLLVSVEEREPVAVAPIAGESWLVDASGKAFVPAPSPTPLPRLLGASAPHDPRLAEGVAWLGALAAQGLTAPAALALADVDPARAPALTLAASTPAPGALVLLGTGEREAKLARLARLFESALPELGTAAEIDLRFGSDVILRPRPEAEVAKDSNDSNGG